VISALEGRLACAIQADSSPEELADRALHAWRRLPPRNIELAIKEIVELLNRQLPQGSENAARHIALCLDEFGRED
jgi:hypothetical protein